MQKIILHTWVCNKHLIRQNQSYNKLAAILIQKWSNLKQTGCVLQDAPLLCATFSFVQTGVQTHKHGNKIRRSLMQVVPGWVKVLLSGGLLMQLMHASHPCLTIWLTQRLATTDRLSSRFTVSAPATLLFHGEWHHTILTPNALNTQFKNPGIKTLISITVSIACALVSFWPWLGRRPPRASPSASNITEQLSCRSWQFPFLYSFLHQGRIILYWKKHQASHSDRSVIHSAFCRLKKTKFWEILHRNNTERNLLSSSWAAMFAESH